MKFLARDRARISHTLEPFLDKDLPVTVTIFFLGELTLGREMPVATTGFPFDPGTQDWYGGCWVGFLHCNKVSSIRRIQMILRFVFVTDVILGILSLLVRCIMESG